MIHDLQCTIVGQRRSLQVIVFSSLIVSVGNGNINLKPPSIRCLGYLNVHKLVYNFKHVEAGRIALFTVHTYLDCFSVITVYKIVAIMRDILLFMLMRPGVLKSLRYYLRAQR